MSNNKTPGELPPGLQRILDRKELFIKFGYNIDRERDAILDQSSPLRGKILEVGTGKGHFAAALAKRGISFISVDISREDQELATLYLKFLKLNHFADFRLQSGEKLDFEAGSFDMVFSISALHHFERPFSVIDELVRVLAPNGRLILSDFSEKGFETIDQIHALDGDVHDRGKTKLQEVEFYLLQKNFRAQRFGTVHHETLIAEKPQ